MQHGEVTGQFSETSNPDKPSAECRETPAAALLEALAGAGLHVHPATWKAFAAWVKDVERWRDSTTAECFSCGRRFPTLQEGLAHTYDRNTCRQPDATTAALQRKVAEREEAECPGGGNMATEFVVDDMRNRKCWCGHVFEIDSWLPMPRHRRNGALLDVEPTAPAAATVRRTHGRCGGTILTAGQWEKCQKCGSSWLAKPSARPQSPWVPDARDSNVSDFDATKAMAVEIAELKAKVAAYEDQALRHKDDLAQRDAEIVRLKTANELQAPSERSAAGNAFVHYLGKMLLATSLNDPIRSHRNAQEVLRTLRGCLDLGPMRIEFGVKEVLP